MNYSTTQLNNLIRVISGILVLIGAQPFSEEESNAILIVVGIAGEVITTVIAWLKRYKKGDITVAGFRKN